MNPAEQGFHFMKAWLHQYGPKVDNVDEIPWLVHQSLDAITPELMEIWATQSGYM